MEKDLFNTIVDITTPINEIQILARTTDPHTSHIAAKKYQPRAASNLMKVFAIVQENPRKTAGELGELTELGHVATQRNLSALCKKGLIKKCAARNCLLKGSLMLTWEII